MENKILIVGKDVPWNRVDGQVCRVIEFSSFGKVENRKVLDILVSSPYASLTVEFEKLSECGIIYIFHKTDFLNLTKAFQQKKKDNEVLVIWTTKHYKNFIYKSLSPIMPKLIIWVCKKDSFKIMTDCGYRPELSGEARFLAEKPIVEYKSEAMK